MKKRSGIIATKIGNSSYYTESGAALPVTILKVDDCVVSQIKSLDKKPKLKFSSDIIIILLIVGSYSCMHTVGLGSHRTHRPSPADEGVDQIRNKKLQIHACAHKRVYVFTVTDHHPGKGPFSGVVSVRLSID